MSKFWHQALCTLSQTSNLLFLHCVSFSTTLSTRVTSLNRLAWFSLILSGFPPLSALNSSISNTIFASCIPWNVQTFAGVHYLNVERKCEIRMRNVWNHNIRCLHECFVFAINGLLLSGVNLDAKFHNLTFIIWKWHLCD